MKTQTKRNLIGLAIVIVIVVVAAVALLWVKSNALEREIAAWEAAGLPLDPKELLPPAPPDAENAAVAYLNLIASPDAGGWPETIRTRPDDPKRFRADDVVDHFEELIGRLREILHSGQSWGWPASVYEVGLLEDTPSLRFEAKLFFYEAEVRAEQGDWEGVAESLSDAMLLAGHAGSYPDVIGPLLQMGIDQGAMRLIQQFGGDVPIPTEEIERQLRERDYRSAAVQSLNGEAARMWFLRDSWDTMVPIAMMPLGSVWVKDEAAFYFASNREAIERLQASYLNQKDPEWRPDEEEGGSFANFYMRSFPPLNKNVAQGEARRRMALLAFELRRQKELRGSYEAALAQAEVPLSPITGEPFTVVIDGDGIIISTPPAHGEELIEWRWK